ncbi:MAG: hypothetical protein KGN36_20015 [Acidobacteriota bacterium]|nr:hypothetical protein [Acidobacteriota bacterium]
MPDDWYRAGLLPFTEMARAARVVVSRGGSGGLYPALAAGTPVLGIPSNADQQLSTAVLVESGAGLGVRVEEAAPGRLRAALGKLLSGAAFLDAAHHLSDVFTKESSSGLFRRFLAHAVPGPSAKAE